MRRNWRKTLAVALSASLALSMNGVAMAESTPTEIDPVSAPEEDAPSEEAGSRETEPEGSEKEEPIEKESSQSDEIVVDEGDDIEKPEENESGESSSKDSGESASKEETGKDNSSDDIVVDDGNGSGSSGSGEASGGIEEPGYVGDIPVEDGNDPAYETDNPIADEAVDIDYSKIPVEDESSDKEADEDSSVKDEAVEAESSENPDATEAVIPVSPTKAVSQNKTTTSEDAVSEIPEVDDSVEEEIPGLVEEEEDLGPFGDLARNYTTYLPQYSQAGVSANSRVPVSVSCDGSYIPGKVTVNYQVIDGVQKDGRDVAILYEYYDKYPEYDGRAHTWDRVYWNYKKGKWSKPEKGTTDSSGSISVNAALILLDEDGNPTWDKADKLDGVRVSGVKLKYNVNASMDEEGEWLTDEDLLKVRKGKLQTPYLRLSLAIDEKRSGLSEEDIKDIQGYLKGMRLDFGILQRNIIKDRNQYDKLTLARVRDEDEEISYEVRGLKVRIRYPDQDKKNTYLNKDLSLEEYENPEDDKSSGAYEVIVEESDRIVIRGKRNFCGMAVWEKDPVEESFDLQ
ncbi:MAG: hypothetical protein K5989_07380 [Lachnospiraceae bacterium]|nr:hypothetical protein [Lachnospiraceae bacterium]